MKKLFLLLITISCFGQEDAWVYFNAKPMSAYYLSNPLQMLTQRSLDRRTLQNIPLDFKDVPVHQAYIDQITTSTGITVMAKSKWLNALHIRGSITNINALSALPFVESVKFANKSLNPNGRLSQNKNKQKSIQKLLTNYDYGGANNQISIHNGQTLHQQNYTGTGKIIAVLDAGFPAVNTLATFNKIRTNNQILGGYNYVARSTNFYTANDHGTMVLSTIAGYTPSQLVGTAPDASFYLFVTEDAGSENPVEESLWVEAAEEADRLGADIINSSLGYFDYDNTAYSHTYQEMNGTTAFISRGADIAFTRGMIVVSSAGNSGASSDPNIAAPADAINVLTVGAIDANKNYVSFSSIGPSADNRIKPDVMAKGASATIATTSGAISTGSGTSFSSPILCGLVACLWQAFPNKKNSEIVQMIKQSSDKFANPNNQYGYGVPDFSLALSNGLKNESFTNNEISIYPNPTNADLVIQFEKNVPVTITFYNAIGQEIMTENAVSNQKISLNNLPSGLYIYSVLKDNQQHSGKLIKY